MVERRIWRLGYLLTGDSAGAAGLVDRVLRTRPDAVEMEPPKLDRLIIQQAREGPRRQATPGASETPEQKVLREAQLLSEQPREAWVLSRIDRLDELHVSLAMDCSRSATRNHLAAADEQMRARLYGKEEPIEALRRFADGLDPGDIIAAHRAEQRARARRRLAVIGAIAFVALLLAAYAALKILASS
jgi:hypothetical protein